MATKRFELENYSTIELNHVAFPETGRVYAQLPLDADDFEDEGAENGMCLVYDIVAGVVRKPTGTDEDCMLHYSTEREYNDFNVGLNKFVLKTKQWNPRLGALQAHDLFTTNCLCYDDVTYATPEALIAATKNVATSPLYVVPDPTGAWKVTAVKPAATVKTAGRIVKSYTMPSGEFGVKIEIL